MIDTSFDLRPPPECDEPYTISAINEAIAQQIERNNTLVWFTGEISNLTCHTSGHCYLKLKDASSQIPAVIWRSGVRKMTFKPENGMEVTGIASVRVYRKGGYYQLDIHRLQPSGLGAHHVAFETLKRKLEAEGLFDPARKKSLPRSVSVLGVVTSKSGAAIRDIIRVVSTRAPHTTIILVNARVQGDGAAGEIAEGIRLLNERGGIDAIIVGRGGGSIEDLWAFNEEIVARAIIQSRIAVISAVGHETDFTIADFVADIRAATPSAAAEIAVADEQEKMRYFSAIAAQYLNTCFRRITEKKDAFRRLCANAAFKRPLRLLSDAHQTIDGQSQRCYHDFGIALGRHVSRFRADAAHLHALSPLRILSRGYSVVSLEDGTVVRNAGQVVAGTDLSLRFSRGGARATVTDVSS